MSSTYTLWCLIDGANALFDVSIQTDSNISHLKRRIKQECSPDLDKFSAANLILWKTDVGVDEEIDDRIRAGQYQPHLPPKPLSARKRISEVWPESPPKDRLHVYIRQPSPAIPQTAVFNDNQPSPKRPRLDDGSLEGWLQLHDDDPWKIFGDYWRKKNDATMSGVLSITPANDEKGKEDTKYRLPFVATAENKIIVRESYKPLYEYMCLLREKGLKGLVVSGQPGTGKTIWLSYALVRLLMVNETVVYYSTAGTHLFSGNSVYRRTWGAIPPADSVTFCLIDLDHRKDPAEISFMTHSIYTHTFPVMAASPNPSRYQTWQSQRKSVPIEYMPLWERDELKRGLEIQQFYNDLRKDVETVLSPQSVDDSSITSPIREDWRDRIVFALKTVKESAADATEDEETEEGATEHEATEHDAMSDVTRHDATDDAPATVTVDGVLDQLLDNVIEAYGLSARDVYAAIVSPRLARLEIDKALNGLTYDSLRKAVTNVGFSDPTDTVPHTIFLMYPTKTIGSAHEYTGRFEVKFKSLWIRSLVLDKLDFLQHLTITFLVQEMAHVTPAATYAGFWYELIATRVLASGASQDLVKMTAKKGSTTFSVPDNPHTIKSPFNRKRETFRIISPDSLANIPSDKNISDYFWLPIALNNGLFDAFVIEFSSSAQETEFDDPAQNINAAVWILQMTLSKDHGGSPKGYSMIRSIKEKVQEVMGTACRQENVKVNYVLVSPGLGLGKDRRWKLPKTNRSLCTGDVYYLPVSYNDTTGT